MKKYNLHAVIDGQNVEFNRQFTSRGAALDYIFDFFASHGYADFAVNDEYEVNDNKHDIEYVYDYENRFRIERASI